MEMVKKSGLALMLGAVMMSSMMVAADAAVAVGAPQVSHFQKLAGLFHWPVLDLSNLSKPKIIAAAALICLPFFLLHSSFCSDRLKGTNGQRTWYDKIIGSKERKEKETQKGWEPKVPCSGIFGNIESNFLEPWSDTLKSVTPIIAILLFLGAINQAGHH